MKTVDFYELPSELADRLRWGMRGQFDPKPLLFQRATRPRTWRWLAASVGATALLAVVWLFGYGELEAALARQPVAMAALYAILVTVVAWGVLEAVAERVRRARLPFTPGIYLFGANLIDARARQLQVLPIEGVTEVEPQGNAALRVVFGDRRFVFSVAPAHLERATSLVRQAVDHAKRGLGRASRFELDPLEAPAVAMPLPPQEAPVAPPPRWPRYAPVFAAVIGLSGVGLFFVRDQRSDERMFAAARAADDVATYQRYLERGHAHTDEVARRLLPLAALRPAVAEGTVAAIDAFRKAYPDHDIATEVEAARRTAVAAAFERARSDGSLTSLASFAERHPDHHLDGPYREAMKSLYRRALEEAQAKMPPTAKRERELVAEILTWGERVGARPHDGALKGPTVMVRLHQRPAKGMGNAEKLVRINPYYGGDRSLPSRYLDRAHLEPLERDAATTLAGAFAKAFRPELLSFAAGPAADETTAFEVPTFVIRYAVEPSGQVHASRKPRGIYIGLLVVAEVELWLPGTKEPFTTKINSAQRLPLQLLEEGADVEGAVYRKMMKDGLEEVVTAYLAGWLRTGS
jgi:hypothetical protein